MEIKSIPVNHVNIIWVRAAWIAHLVCQESILGMVTHKASKEDICNLLAWCSAYRAWTLASKYNGSGRVDYFHSVVGFSDTALDKRATKKKVLQQGHN